jgi:predicted ArsR family transcriptional regulator
MSQRQIAKRAGVSQMQVRRDLKRNGSKTETKRHDKEAMDIDVTRCPFAEFFRALGEPELGALLICETDFDIVATGGGAVTLTREQTIMQGAPSCTFRYSFAPRD